jgi:hypothetical protein
VNRYCLYPPVAILLGLKSMSAMAHPDGSHEIAGLGIHLLNEHWVIWAALLAIVLVLTRFKSSGVFRIKSGSKDLAKTSGIATEERS